METKEDRSHRPHRSIRGEAIDVAEAQEDILEEAVVLDAEAQVLAAVEDQAAGRLRRGDRLVSIAKKYKTTVKRLMRLNRIKNPKRLRLGQKLRLR